MTQDGADAAGLRPKRRAHSTILDVAERAGVSKSLVSLVMRGSAQVSEEKRTAVLRAADELGYRPNAAARSLVRRHSSMIGVMISDLHNPFFAEVVDGIEEEAQAAGYHALFSTGGRRVDGESVAIERLLQLRTDGLILASVILPAREVLAAAATTPVVLIARPSRWREVDSVTNDDRAGARLAVDHLFELGHRSIAHIDGGKGAGAASRRSGFVEAMSHHDLAESMFVVAGDYTEDGGAKGISALLRTGRRPTAIFVANDLAAVGALQALGELGYQVPRDVSLIGYDNIALAGLRHINLTTVDQPRRHVGATAVRLLLERLDEGRGRARHLVVAPSLVVRGTTAAPG